MFTKKHHEAIAASIKPIYQEVLESSVVADKLNVVGDIGQSLSELFSKDNNNFDPDAFATFITE